MKRNQKVCFTFLLHAAERDETSLLVRLAMHRLSSAASHAVMANVVTRQELKRKSEMRPAMVMHSNKYPCSIIDDEKRLLLTADLSLERLDDFVCQQPASIHFHYYRTHVSSRVQRLRAQRSYSCDPSHIAVLQVRS